MSWILVLTFISFSSFAANENCVGEVIQHATESLSFPLDLRDIIKSEKISKKDFLALPEIQRLRLEGELSSTWRYDPDKTASEVAKLLEEKIELRYKGLHNIQDVLDLVENSEKLGFPKHRLVEFLKDNPLVKEGIVDIEDFFLSRDDLRNKALANLKLFAQESKNSSQFLTLISMIGGKFISREDISGIVYSSPFFQNDLLARLNRSVVKERIDIIGWNQFLQDMSGPEIFIESVIRRHELGLEKSLGRYSNVVAEAISSPGSRMHKFDEIRVSKAIHGEQIKFLVKKYFYSIDRKEMIQGLSSNKFFKRKKITKSDIETILDNLDRNLEKLNFDEAYEKSFRDHFGDEIMERYDPSGVHFTQRENRPVEVKDQCKWESCWIQAKTELDEYRVSQKVNDSWPLSVDYSFYGHIENELLRVMAEVNSGKRNPQTTIIEGELNPIYLGLRQKYGLMPKSAWKPKISIHSLEGMEKMKDIFREVVAQIKRDNKSISPEFAQKLLNEFKDKVQEAFGEIPSEFEFNGEKHTPQSFAKKYSNNEGDVQKVIQPEDDIKKLVHGEPGKVYSITQDGVIARPVEYSAREETPDVMLSSIRKRIDNGDAVYIGIRVTGPNDRNAVFDVYTGELSIDGEYQKHSVFQKDGYHALLITGYELDIHGNISGLKALNSWGDYRGDNGFLYLDRAYFEQAVRVVHE